MPLRADPQALCVSASSQNMRRGTVPSPGICCVLVSGRGGSVHVGVPQTVPLSALAVAIFTPEGGPAGLGMPLFLQFSTGRVLAPVRPAVSSPRTRTGTPAAPVGAPCSQPSPELSRPAPWRDGSGSRSTWPTMDESRACGLESMAGVCAPQLPRERRRQGCIGAAFPLCLCLSLSPPYAL